MNYILRKWRLSDAADLAAALNNEKVLNNLRDGLPYPYTEQDASDYISAMLCADEMPSRAMIVPSAASVPFGRAISTGRRQSWATIWLRNTGAGAS